MTIIKGRKEHFINVKGNVKVLVVECQWMYEGHLGELEKYACIR